MTDRVLKVLIADDVEGMRLILRKYIEQTDGFTVIGEAQTGQETLALFDQFHPDIVFLDVDMPEKNGIECAHAMMDYAPSTLLVFATGHEEYMGEAFNVYAFDYLVKPFKLSRLQQTLERILTIKTQNKSEQETPKSVKERTVSPVGKWMVKHKEGVSFVNFEDVLLIQREERTTAIYLQNGQKLITTETLSQTEEKLDKDMFLRTHKSYIVNLSKITQVAPYGRWTYILRLEGTRQDALITHDKYAELEKLFG